MGQSLREVDVNIFLSNWIEMVGANKHMTIHELAKNLEISVEELKQWIQVLQIAFPEEPSAAASQVSEAWLPYFKKVKALFAAGRQPEDIRKAVPLPKVAAKELPTSPKLEESLQQLEKQMINLQFYLKNTQSEMVKEQKNLAKLQKQVDDFQRTIDMFQHQFRDIQVRTNKLTQIQTRFWLYQGITILVSVLLALILGRVFTPAQLKVQSPIPQTSPILPNATENVRMEPTVTPSPETTALP